MAVNEIVKGSVVLLKSGGPKMTVAWVEDGEVGCEWFNDKMEPQFKAFPATSLKLYD